MFLLRISWPNGKPSCEASYINLAKKSEAKGRKGNKGCCSTFRTEPLIHGVDIIYWTPLQIEVTEEEEEEEE